MNDSKLWALDAQCFLNLDEDIYSVIFPVVVLYLSLGFRKQVDSWERCVLLFLSARRSGIPQRTDKFPASTDETLSQCSQLMFQFSVENDKRKKNCWLGIKQTSFLEVYSRHTVAAAWRRWPDLTNFDVCLLCFLLNRAAFWSLCK